jgi:tagatose-1,6-bisphosphate aldolase non-catalytic subunit AgaZ/GatZ
MPQACNFHEGELRTEQQESFHNNHGNLNTLDMDASHSKRIPFYWTKSDINRTS